MSDPVKVSTERALTKSPTVYPFFESVKKSLIIQAAQICFVNENIFGNEPCGVSLLVWSETNFSAGQHLNPRISNTKNVHFEQNRKSAWQHGPLAGTTIDTTKNTCRFYNTICAFDFTKGGNGIEVADFEGNHDFLLFDSNSLREARKALISFPELTGAGITSELSFAGALSNPVEPFHVSERFSQICIDGKRTFSKNRFMNE